MLQIINHQKMQVKNTMRYHYIPNRMAKIKRTDQRLIENVEKPGPVRK